VLGVTTEFVTLLRFQRVTVRRVRDASGSCLLSTRETLTPWRPSPRTRLSRAPSTMTPPTLISGIGGLLTFTACYKPPTFIKMDSAR
jgi:hypothetical protein